MSNLLYEKLFGQHAGRASTFLHLENGKIYSYDDFLRLTGRFANLLVGLGLTPGDRVAVQVDKSAETLAVYAACVQAGMVFLPLNTGYTPREISYFLCDSGAGLLICQGEIKPQLEEVAILSGAILRTLNADGSGSFTKNELDMPDTFATVDREISDLAALLYTSGTTGRSKGAMLTQGNLLSNAQTLADLWQFSDKDNLLHALPIFHTHGLFVATNVTLIAGGSMVLLPRFDLDSLIKHMPFATSLMGVPTFYTRLLEDPRFDKSLTQNVRLFVSGSAPLLAETHMRFEERTGHKILERYGMTETSMNTSNPYDGERRAGTVGFALPGIDLKITDANTGETLTGGEIGQIEVRGPNVFKGYWKMPEKTAQELREDGYFITGDLGRIDQDGYLHIVGRNKDMIISGGYNVYPKEIEQVIDEYPGVLESAVIGVPDPDLGEVAIGILVAETGSTLNLERISDTLSNSLAKFKRPRKLLVVSELPRNTMGKVQKNLLRDEHKSVK